MLIILEGIDGAGTTTQTRMLHAALVERGMAAHATREPSDGPVGKLLRQMLSGAHAPVDATTMALLFAADRADHVQREVDPALAEGKVVVSDRWYHSSLAYQGTEEDRAWIAELNRRARRPDLTIFLAVDPTVAAQRRADALRTDELFDAAEVQRRVAAGYRDVMKELARVEHIESIDGERPAEVVAADCLRLALAALEARR